MTQVSARIGTEGAGTDHEETYDRKVTVDYDFLDKNLNAKIEAWTPEVVDVLAQRSAIVALRNQITNYIRAKKTDEEIAELVASWVPPMGAVRAKKTKLQRATEAAKDMSPEQLDELMKELKGLKKASA